MTNPQVTVTPHQEPGSLCENNSTSTENRVQKSDISSIYLGLFDFIVLTRSWCTCKRKDTEDVAVSSLQNGTLLTANNYAVPRNSNIWNQTMLQTLSQSRQLALETKKYFVARVVGDA